MKFVITIITVFAISTTSLAQHPCHSTSEINFGASTKAKKPIKKVNIFKIGRIEVAQDYTSSELVMLTRNGDNGYDYQLLTKVYHLVKSIFMLFDQLEECLLDTPKPSFNCNETVNT